MIFSIFSDIKKIHCYGNVHSLTLPIPRGRGGKGGEVEPTPLMFFVNNFHKDKAIQIKFRLSLLSMTTEGVYQFRGVAEK